jgi:hypothetical protein
MGFTTKYRARTTGSHTDLAEHEEGGTQVVGAERQVGAIAHTDVHLTGRRMHGEPARSDVAVAADGVTCERVRTSTYESNS